MPPGLALGFPEIVRLVEVVQSMARFSVNHFALRCASHLVSPLTERWCWTVIPDQHFRVLKQRFQPSLFTKFLTLNRVTVERDAGFPVDRDLAQKNPRVILRMSLFLDLDDFVGWHAR